MQEDLLSTTENTEELKEDKFLENILKACISSPRASPIYLHEERSKVFATRAQIHCLRVGRFGTGKTTDLLELKGQEHEILTDYTSPGITGTITAEGDYVKGSIIGAAGKVFVVDEMQKLNRSSKEVMNTLLESQYAARNLGYEIKKPTNRKQSKAQLNKGIKWSIKARKKTNKFRIHSRFSALFAGTRPPGDPNSESTKMWMSRFVVVNVKKTPKDIFNMLRGKSKLTIEANDYSGGVHFKNYLKFVDRYEKLFEKLKFRKHFDNEPGYLSRNCNDMARYACYLSGSAGESEVTDDAFEQALNMVPFALYNYIKKDLTEIDYTLLRYYEDLTQKEISEICNTDQSSISRHIKRLKQSGLIE